MAMNLGGSGDLLSMILNGFMMGQNSAMQKEKMAMEKEAWGLKKEQADTAMKQQKMILDTMEKSIQGGILTPEQASTILLDPKGLGSTLFQLAQWSKPQGVAGEIAGQQQQQSFETEGVPFRRQDEMEPGPQAGGQPGITGMLANQQLFGGMSPQDIFAGIMSKQFGVQNPNEPVKSDLKVMGPSGKLEYGQMLRGGGMRPTGVGVPPEYTWRKVENPQKPGEFLDVPFDQMGQPNWDAAQKSPQEVMWIRGTDASGNPIRIPVPKHMGTGGAFGVNEPVRNQILQQEVPGGGTRPMLINPYSGRSPGGGGGTGTGYTKLPEQDLPIKADDIPLYVHKDTLQSPDPGLSHKQAHEKGFVRVTTQAKNQIDALKGAGQVIGQLGEMMMSVFPEKGGFEERISGAPSRWLGATMQTNAPAAQLSGFISGTLAPTIRSLGEKGNLSDNDMKRAVKLFPSLTDSADVAWRNYRQLNTLFQNIQKSVISGSYKTTSKGPNLKLGTSKEDPLGLR